MNDSFTSVWDDAGASAEEQAGLQAMAGARAATRDLWPFFALATSDVEFDQRVGLADDSIIAAAALHEVPVDALVSEYRREFGLLMESRTAALPVSDRCSGCLGTGVTQSVHSGEWQDTKPTTGTCATCGGSGKQPTQKDSSKKTAGHSVEVSAKPKCDVCRVNDGVDKEADYDSRLPGLGGSWGNVCAQHFQQFGPGQTGTGHAQKFVVKGSAKTADAKCPNCNGAGAIPALGHERPEDVDNGYAMCPTCHGTGGAGKSDPEEQWNPKSEQTAQERFGDTKWSDYYGKDPGDEADDFYERYSSLKTALEEGEDPLLWLEQEGGGQGAPEKPGGHSETEDLSGSYSEVPSAAQAVNARKNAVRAYAGDLEEGDRLLSGNEFNGQRLSRDLKIHRVTPHDSEPEHVVFHTDHGLFSAPRGRLVNVATKSAGRTGSRRPFPGEPTGSRLPFSGGPAA